MGKKILTSISFLLIFIYFIFNLKRNISINDLNKSIKVEVRGDVKNNITIELKLGSKFEDVLKYIELTETSDISNYSLNMPLSNNMIINIRSIEKDKELISINNATLEELCLLPGIGEKIALKIIEYRNNNGSFHYIEEIQNISGIGEKKYEKIKNYITL